jgi:hypothetical protein
MKLQIELLIEDFINKCIKQKESCILNAIASGIDLYDMAIEEWFDADENGILTYNCSAVRIKNG